MQSYDCTLIELQYTQISSTIATKAIVWRSNKCMNATIRVIIVEVINVKLKTSIRIHATWTHSDPQQSPLTSHLSIYENNT